MKTLIGINTLTAVDSLIYSNHVQFFYRLGKHFPNDNFILFTPRRMGIDSMRNQACKAAMEFECDYLMFIDDDVIVPLSAFDKLVKDDKDVVAAWTIIRGYPYNNMHFRYKDPEKQQHLDYYNDHPKGGLVEVAAVGCSCVLIKVALLKEMTPPYFVTGPNHTEDVYFCIKAAKQNQATIWVDTDLECGHLLGQDFVTPTTKDQWKAFNEEIDKTLTLPKDPIDRTEEYLEKCLI